MGESQSMQVSGLILPLAAHLSHPIPCRLSMQGYTGLQRDHRLVTLGPHASAGGASNASTAVCVNDSAQRMALATSEGSQLLITPHSSGGVACQWRLMHFERDGAQV